MRPERSAARGRHRVTIRPADRQDEASIQADLDRSLAFGDELAQDGTESWRSKFRWIGPVKVMVAKEVGPPPWPWPRVLVKIHGDFLSVAIGWRLTAYRLHVLWVGHGPERP